MSISIQINRLQYRRRPLPRAIASLASAAVLCGAAGSVLAAPTYSVKSVLVAEDQWKGEAGVTPKPLFKPHETDATFFSNYWISSNERGEEEGGVAVPSKAGITLFKDGSNRVLARVDIEGACLPVVNPNGTPYGCAPPGAEGHPRHPHGIDIDNVRGLAYQVIEHSGLKWDLNRTGFLPAETTDEESGLLLVYDVKDPSKPKILQAYVLGHAAEEVAVNQINGKAYVGNHEPTPGVFPTCFVSVVNRANRDAPYKFIDLPDTDCVQGVAMDMV